jgi:hypothetical protein
VNWKRATLTLALGFVAGTILVFYQLHWQLADLSQKGEQAPPATRCECPVQRDLLFGTWLTNCAGRTLRPADPQYTWCGEVQMILNQR